jgi:hypothetical protein
MSDRLYPASFHSDTLGDHVHAGAREGSAIIPTTPFDYGEPAAPEKLIPMPLVCSAFNGVLNWICAPDSLSMIAARAYTLST